MATVHITLKENLPRLLRRGGSHRTWRIAGREPGRSPDL